jgi:hypothetical protein
MKRRRPEESTEVVALVRSQRGAEGVMGDAGGESLNVLDVVERERPIQHGANVCDTDNRLARPAVAALRSTEVRTGVRTRQTFPALLVHLTKATMRFLSGHATRYGPGRSRTSARGFEVRRSIH